MRINTIYRPELVKCTFVAGWLVRMAHFAVGLGLFFVSCHVDVTRC